MLAVDKMAEVTKLRGIYPKHESAGRLSKQTGTLVLLLLRFFLLLRYVLDAN